MFENWMPNNQLKQELEAEKRQINLAREQSSLAASSDPLYAQEQNAKSDLIRWQQELEDGLEILKMRLRNRTKDSEGNWILPDGKKQLLTEEGICMIESELSPFLGQEAKNLINSNLSEDTILMMLRNTSDTIVDNLADNYDTYVVDPTPANLSHTVRIIKNAIIPTPFRALSGWTKKTDTTGIKRIETFIDSPQDKNKKIMGLF
jgi:benzoyl-CoA reductase/2-hydroxyglutaryl-CoA dehydratase subunit BcrC/BadD/HgdB